MCEWVFSEFEIKIRAKISILSSSAECAVSHMQYCLLYKMVVACVMIRFVSGTFHLKKFYILSSLYAKNPMFFGL